MNRLALSAPLFVALTLVGCTAEEDPPLATGSASMTHDDADTSSTGSSETTVESETGDGDGDGETGTGDGDGDGDGDTGDGDGDGDGDGGSCVDPTPDECMGECVDLQSDENYCGNCSTACAADEACWAGDCYYERTWGMSNAYTNFNFDAFFPKVGMAANGDAVAAFYTFGGTAFDMFAMHYNYAADSWGTPVALEMSNAGDAFGHAVAVAPNGDTLVAWLQSDGSTTNGVFNRYDAGTGSWGGAQNFETDPDPVLDVAVAAADNGDFMLVFTQDAGGATSVWADYYDESANSWDGASTIEFTGGEAQEVDVAFGANGDAFAVWAQQAMGNYSAYAARYASGTGNWGAATLLEGGTAGDVMSPVVGVDGSGNAIVAWSQGAGLYDDIRVNRYDAVGNAWLVNDLLIDAEGIGSASNPTIAMHANGDAVVAWSHNANGTDSIHHNDYELGTGWLGDTLLETNDDGDAVAPDADVDDAGNFVVVWTQFALSETSAYAAHYNVILGEWEEPQTIEDEMPACSGAQTAMNGNGDAVAVWLADDMGDEAVFANRYR